MPEFTLIRYRLLRRIIKSLKLNTASGPDGLPARVFRECCNELAPVIAVLVRFLIRTGYGLKSGDSIGYNLYTKKELLASLEIIAAFI